MKKFVFASALAMACIGLVYTPSMRAQASDTTISIKDPAEYNAYQMASTQTDPNARAAGLETFLQTYPQSVVKKEVLSQLIDTYQALGDTDKTLSAASRLLQIDPTNMKAIFISVFIKKNQCLKTNEAQTCDDAAILAKKGLDATKPAGVSDEDWKKQTAATTPIFHSAIALDDIISKKDIKAGIEEYRQELMLYTPEETEKGPGLVDTLDLAQAYAKLTPPDMVDAIWFYARALAFAPAGYKPVIEKDLDYWYKRYHGSMDGLDAIKSQAAANLFPPGGEPTIKAKATPAEIAHNVVATTPDLTTLNLNDKEFILAEGTPDDANKLWAVLKDKLTPVPGNVLDAPVTAVKVAVEEIGRAKSTDFTIGLKAPMTCADMPAAGSAIKPVQDFLSANGVPGDDATKLDTLLTDRHRRIRKIVVDGTVSTIKVAVSEDAKTAHIPDFIVNLKTPASCSDIPANGVFGLQPAAELDGTYNSYRQIPATAKLAQTVEIVVGDGFIQPEKKAPAHKPAASHHHPVRR